MSVLCLKKLLMVMHYVDCLITTGGCYFTGRFFNLSTYYILLHIIFHILYIHAKFVLVRLTDGGGHFSS